MTYRFVIEIKPCVNFVTRAAEVSIIDHTYGGTDGAGIVVRQKHIGSFSDTVLAEANAEKYCQALHERLKEFCKQQTANLPNAKP